MGISQIASAVSDPQQLLAALGAVKGMIGELTVDVIVRESPRHSWEVTSHPVESGYEANDLRKKNPDTIILECVWVDKQYGVHDIMSNVLSGEGLMPATWRDKYEALKETWTNDEPLTVVTGLDSYPNMVITEVSPIREQATAGCLSCIVSLTEVRIVSTEERDVDTSLLPTATPKDDAIKKKTAKKKTKRAKANNKAAGADGDKQETSLLYDLFGG